MEAEKKIRMFGCCGMYIIYGCISCMILASMGCLIALAVIVL